ncbi:Odorant receptor [Operophtera brumata]|uniref:Odorant receptor n=1 Tax=Operophtera brumata TaxID=104452 RepID=A0A0L7KVT8_OPEBR|nr:Odorant receptor [Operophtera brumata]
MERKIPYESVMPHLKSLRTFGYYQIDAKYSKFQKFLQSSYMCLILSLISIFTMQQVAKVYQVMDDPNKVIDTMFLLLTNSDSIYKQVIFWRKHDQIEELLKILQVLLRGFNIAALLTCLLWVLCPMILYTQSKPVEFAIWLPFDPNRSPQFYYAILYVWVQTSWLAYGNTSMDTFITYFFAQCKTQLSILSEIVRLCNKTQGIFGGAIFYFFLVSAWIICTTAYRIITKIPQNYRFSLLLFMERIKRRIEPMAGVIIPLSLNTFVSTTKEK